MNRILYALRISWLALLLCTARSAGAAVPSAEFLSPAPGAHLVLPQTNIIFRPGGVVTAGATPVTLAVTGSSSGPHGGDLRVTESGRTLIFRPDQPFLPSETVTCRLEPGLVTDTRGAIPPGEFSFTIAGPERDRALDVPLPTDADEVAAATTAGNDAAMAPTTAASDTLPFDFPEVHADVVGPTAPGRLFVSDVFFNARGPRIPSYLMILNNDGSPYFYRQIRGVGLDFKVQPNGLLTWFDSASDAFYAMNAQYAVVDSFRCGNGYSTDNHDLLLLPNGHFVLMSYDPEIVDLSAVGGSPSAIVIGLIIQELDADRNVVFQWRSWDHFQVTDMMFHRIDDPLVDYVHGNSIDVDPEGNFILSCRHMNEVTKISRATGEILWRLGGRHNQFRFVNEPLSFSHQHHVRLLPDGHLTMFDNGNFRPPLFSRAVEYALDEANRTATLVWQYRLTPDVFGVAFGSVQRLPNGNTLIGWGATTPTLTEVTPQGTIVSRLSFGSAVSSYRAFRYEWPPVRPALVNLDPNSISIDPLNVPDRERGNIHALIEPENGDFAIDDVDVGTVRLQGTVPADSTHAQSDKTSLSVEFDREAVEALLVPGTNRLEVTGMLRTGESFRGVSEIDAVGSVARRSTDPKLVSAPGRLPVVLQDAGAPGAPRTITVYDVRGRRVKHWTSPDGLRVSWDGRRDDGRPVSSGIYWVRVGAASGTPLPGGTIKVAIVR